MRSTVASLFAAVLTALLGIFLCPTHARANSIAVGTDLCLCLRSSALDVLPQVFIAQTFNVPNAITASNIYFVVRTTSSDTAGVPNPIDYGTLSFNMQLTNAIGPGTTSNNVITNASFALPTSSAPTYSLLSIPLNMILAAGTYYLIASTPTAIPNSSSILQLVNAANYFPNVGQELAVHAGTNEVTNVVDLLNACSPSATLNCAFPPASTWGPATGPAQPLPMEFQLCSEDDGSGCGLTTGPPPPPGAPVPAALPLFVTGLTGLSLLGWRRKRKAQAVA
jgi:hypothetical protein